ncbi:MAG: helix-turn-helix transcriptional regulator [bacterium]|nr:helix-turn-helix transcriptional regulator [bacterium]
MNANAVIGARLERVRKKNNLSKVDVIERLANDADFTEISKATYGRYEAGQTPATAIFLLHFGRCFAVSAQYLLYGNGGMFLEGERTVTNPLEAWDRFAETLEQESGHDGPAFKEPYDFEAISAGTPENYIELFKYMEKDKTLRRAVLLNFFIIQKAAAEKRIEVETGGIT